jgi:hypothetical protein
MPTHGSGSESTLTRLRTPSSPILVVLQPTTIPLQVPDSAVPNFYLYEASRDLAE